jgi:putative addiction module component (TIGR02574 family)
VDARWLRATDARHKYSSADRRFLQGSPELAPKERLDLIGQLWDSLSPSDVQLTQAQEAELDRRLASFDEDARSAIAWEKIDADLGRRFR